MQLTIGLVPKLTKMGNHQLFSCNRYLKVTFSSAINLTGNSSGDKIHYCYVFENSQSYINLRVLWLKQTEKVRKTFVKPPGAVCRGL